MPYIARRTVPLAGNADEVTLIVSVLYNGTPPSSMVKPPMNVPPFNAAFAVRDCACARAIANGCTELSKLNAVTVNVALVATAPAGTVNFAVVAPNVTLTVPPAAPIEALLDALPGVGVGAGMTVPADPPPHPANSTAANATPKNER